MPEPSDSLPDEPTLLWIGCSGCSGETQALLGVEGQALDLVDLLDVDGLRLLWHPSLAEHDLRPVHDDLIAGRERLTVLCVEGSIALADDGMYDIAGEVGKYEVVRSLCELADYVLAMGACAGYGGWQAQPPNPSGAVGLQYTLDVAGGLLPPEWRSRAGLPVITLAGCPVPADTQVAALRWALSGAPGGPGRYGTAPMVRPCLPSTEYKGCGTPRQIGLRCTGCTGPKFPNFASDRPLVRWAP
jgi:uptake hydrogenase small subunit